MGEIEVPLTNDSIESTASPAAKSRLDWQGMALAAVKSPYFIPVAVFLGGLTLIYWELLSSLIRLWMGEDGYYTHGFLVPIISGYLIYRMWPRLKEIRISPSMWSLLLLLPMLWVAFVARAVQMQSLYSVSFVFVLISGVWFVFGWRWALATAAPILYLLFALPVWSGFVTNYTNPLQIISTKIAYRMLDMVGSPHMPPNSTDILIGNFWLNVGVPCSGLKLVLAITAFTCFFVLIGGLRWWGNIAMFLAIVPLCLVINGLRIALIGMVGSQYGSDAGMQFHDFSGYITLIVCFFILFKLARVLGWKD